MQHIFVLNANRTPLMPCHPARARQILRRGRAAVLRHRPFTIILKEQITNPVIQPLAVKVDPGSKQTGIALVRESAPQARVLWAAEVAHRGGAHCGGDAAHGIRAIANHGSTTGADRVLGYHLAGKAGWRMC